MSKDSNRRRLARTSASVLLYAAVSLTTAGASATTALFFPKGSGARAERHHLTVALTATGTVTWDAVDISGNAADVGALVAVKAGGKVEVTARAWIDVVEAASRVKVSTIPAGVCKAIGGQSVVPGSGGGDASISISGNAEAEGSGGCNGGGSGSAHVDGGSTGGCFSNASSPSSGCGSCESCEPSEHGHPGCSALMTTNGCGPLGPSTSGGSSGGGVVDGGSTTSRVGPYETLKVHAADGSAVRWLDEHGYERGASFEQAAAALEGAGYELFAMRALPPTALSVIQSLRVVTTSPAPALPLRLLRMGSVAPITPITLVVLANAPQKLVDANVMRIDESALAWMGSSSNYEALATAALGVPDVPDGGGDGGSPSSSTRWLFESARSLANRSTPASHEGGTDTVPTLADDFRARCGDRGPEKHAVCTQVLDAGAIADADIDTGAADPEAGAPDGGASGEAGASDAAADASTSTTGCPDVNRQRCDDIDLAIPANGAMTATRFRGVIGGDPAGLADLVFAASTELLADGTYTIRIDGQPGLCEPSESSVSVSASTDDAVGTCKQTATRTRSLANVDLGPLVMLLAAAGAIAAIMRRARR